MIPFDIRTLKAFIDEQYSFITGARINKIQQPTRREFILTLRKNGVSLPLYINIQPKFHHVCFTSEKNYAKKHLVIPKQPPMFCMLLRKYLENSKISKVNQVEDERILEFYVETYNETGDKIYLCLAIELMGKHSNIILYNADTGIIIGCAHNVGADKSRKREVYGGIPYIYPPHNTKGSNSFKSLVVEFASQESKNALIDNYYSDFIYEYKYDELKNKLKTKAARLRTKILNSTHRMEQKLLSDEKSDTYRLYGDLLMANLYNLKDYTDAAEVYDYENNKTISIPLDIAKTVKENANRYYKLYNKSKNAKVKLTELIAAQNAQKDYYEQILYSINQAQNIEDLEQILPELDEDVTPVKNDKNFVSQITCLEQEDQTRIYIGKNNKQNDYIISKLASDEDLWFHVHNNAGSHVLLKTQKISDELILKCAKLAKEYSSVKDSSKIGVIYTKRKYLRKPPGANLGYVTYKNEKEIILD